MAVILAYRYCSASETMVIKSSLPMRVPNIDRSGKPKTVFMTLNMYTSVSKAEKALQIGAFHPSGPFASPSDRLDLDLNGIAFINAGIVPGGTGTELTTTASPPVTAIAALKNP